MTEASSKDSANSVKSVRSVKKIYKKFQTHAYTTTKILYVPQKLDILEIQLRKRYNKKRIPKRLLNDFNKTQVENWRNSHLTSELVNKSDERNSKYITIALDIKKDQRNSQNCLSNNTENNQKSKILSLFDQTTCSCEEINSLADNESAKLLSHNEKSILNANENILDYKVFCYLAIIMLIVLIGLTSLILLQEKVQENFLNSLNVSSTIKN